MAFTKGGQLPFGPVRTVTNNNREYGNIVGSFYSYKTLGPVVYESKNERSFMQALELSPSVQAYYPQPLAVPVTSTSDGKTWAYTPDVLVMTTERTLLCEVKKTLDECREVADSLRGAAARRLARQNRWQFRLCRPPENSAVMIRNVDVLMRYRVARDQEVEHDCLRLMMRKPQWTAQEVAARLCPERDLAETLPLVYHLIATSVLFTDLSAPVNPDSSVSTEPEEGSTIENYLDQWWALSPE